MEIVKEECQTLCNCGGKFRGELRKVKHLLTKQHLKYEERKRMINLSSSNSSYSYSSSGGGKDPFDGCSGGNWMMRD